MFLVHEDDAQVEVGPVGSGVQGNGLAEQGNRRFLVAGLVGQKAQQMMSLGVPRIGLEDLPVEGFGLRQVAALMELNGTLK